MPSFKNRMLYALLALLLCAMLLGCAPLTAHADTAPKPAVHVAFSGIAGECYGTLLSQQPSTGPAWAVEDPDCLLTEEEEAALQGQLESDGITRDIWEAFVRYEDTDGFYYLQETWHCSDESGINWTYYPPNTFKVLLYFPQTGAFLASDICKTYAFHSYYSVVVAEDFLTAERDYPYGSEVLSLLCRIVITVALEIGLALLFALREKKVLLAILAANAVTQIALNVALNLIDFAAGPLMFVIWFVLLELLITAAEAVAYALLLPRLSQRPLSRLRVVLYALCANLLSFGAGLGLSIILPGIFT